MILNKEKHFNNDNNKKTCYARVNHVRLVYCDVIISSRNIDGRIGGFFSTGQYVIVRVCVCSAFVTRGWVGVTTNWLLLWVYELLKMIVIVTHLHAG